MQSNTSNNCALITTSAAFEQRFFCRFFETAFVFISFLWLAAVECEVVAVHSSSLLGWTRAVKFELF